MPMLTDSVRLFLPAECTSGAFPFDNAFFKWVHLLQVVDDVGSIIASNRSKCKMASSTYFARLLLLNNKINT
jgi:hypothetical protein